MTEINIYCDESRHTSDPSQRFMVIGGLRCPREQKRDLVARIHRLQAQHNAHGELGWKRVSPNREAFYLALVDLFANEPNLSFRCLVADRGRLDHDRYNDGDAELGFYKLYYQMLVHWLQPGENHYIYLDWQQNRQQHRFHDLQASLAARLRHRAGIACLEPVTSSNLPLIGMVDLLIGAVGYAWNGLNGSAIKLRLIDNLAAAGNLARIDRGTNKTARKINIFAFEGGTGG